MAASAGLRNSGPAAGPAAGQVELAPRWASRRRNRSRDAVDRRARAGERAGGRARRSRSRAAARRQAQGAVVAQQQPSRRRRRPARRRPAVRCPAPGRGPARGSARWSPPAGARPCRRARRVARAGAREQDRHLAAGPVQVRLDDLQHEAGGDGGVEGVAAALQHRHPDCEASQCVEETMPKGAGELRAGGERGAHADARLDLAGGRRTPTG